MNMRMEQPVDAIREWLHFNPNVIKIHWIGHVESIPPDHLR